MKTDSIFCFAIVLLLQGCGQKGTQSPQILRTDPEPISRRLPELGSLHSVLWSSELISKDSFLSPPVIEPTYRVRGFAYLPKERAVEIFTQFEWQNVSNGWKPSLSTTNKLFEPAQWWRSDGFTRKMKPDQFPGDLFLNTNEAVVFFDIEVK